MSELWWSIIEHIFQFFESISQKLRVQGGISRVNAVALVDFAVGFSGCRSTDQGGQEKSRMYNKSIGEGRI